MGAVGVLVICAPGGRTLKSWRRLRMLVWPAPLPGSVDAAAAAAPGNSAEARQSPVTPAVLPVGGAHRTTRRTDKG